MAKKNSRATVLARASDLDKAVACLNRTLGREKWLDSLTKAATYIREKCKGDDWEVNITDMEIPIESPKHLNPGKLSKNLKLYVSIHMKGSGKKWEDEEDCLLSLGFRVEVRGIDKQNPQDSFHTGFHIDKVGDKDDSSEMHPLYHVHFLNDSFIGGTNALSMDVPRLVHHPVDVLLGILMVYANYNQTGYNKLLHDGIFMGICRNSAKHILTPYYKSLSRVPWTEGSISDYDKLLCPYLIG